MKRRLDERNWKKKDLVAAILAVAPTRTLSGVEAFVRRASHGKNIAADSRALIDQVLGLPEEPDPAGGRSILDHLVDIEAGLEELALAVHEGLEKVGTRLDDLDQRLPAKRRPAQLATAKPQRRRASQ